MGQKNSKILFVNLWIITVAFYLLRSIFEPFKYIALISYTFLFVISIVYYFKTAREVKIVSFFLQIKEFFVISLIVIFALAISSSLYFPILKEIFNILIIISIGYFYFLFKEQISFKRFVLFWLLIVILIGLFGIAKWTFNTFNIGPHFFAEFYPEGTSLVSDFNVYALYLVLSLILYFSAVRLKYLKVNRVLNFLIILILLINILLSQSRRSFILLFLLCILIILLSLINKKKESSFSFLGLKRIIFSAVTAIVLIVLVVSFRSRIVTNRENQIKITNNIFRYATIFKPSISIDLLNSYLWPLYETIKFDKRDWNSMATFNNQVQDSIITPYEQQKNSFWHIYEIGKDTNNLIYNGDFRYGLDFWGKIAPDSVLIEHSIIENTKFGSAIKVSRGNSTGWWPLEYNGRKILYYKDVTYTFKFKYSFNSGGNESFCIGWWIDEGEGYLSNLPHKIYKIDDEWYEFEASYKFKQDHSDLPIFMNSQSPNTNIYFTDIHLTCDDKNNRPKYADEVVKINGINLLYNSNFKNGLTLWGKLSYDSVKHELITTKYGNAIRVSRKGGTQGQWQLIYLGRSVYYYKDLNYSFRFKYRVVQGPEMPFCIGWGNSDDMIPLNCINAYVNRIDNEWYECIASHTFTKDNADLYPLFMNNMLTNTIVDIADIELVVHDSLKRLAYADERLDEIIKIDKNNLQKQILKNNSQGYDEFTSTRIGRWLFAYELFNGASLKKQLFGQGFNYLEQYGEKYYNNPKRYDYPHNPIISSFLYSGIVGGLFYIYFLIMVFWYYWKYKKHIMVFFMMYLVTFFFMMFSGNSHFSVPIFTFLSLVPFITRYYINSEKLKSDSDATPNNGNNCNL